MDSLATWWTGSNGKMQQGAIRAKLTSIKQGQANHFIRFAPERIPYGAQRYGGETERLYGVLDARLADRDFLAGPGRGKFSIADMASLGWVSSLPFAGMDLNMFPNVLAWFNRCWERPAVQRGFSIPSPSILGLKKIEETLRNDPEMKAKQEAAEKFLADAKAQYNYKYQSP